MGGSGRRRGPAHRGHGAGMGLAAPLARVLVRRGVASDAVEVLSRPLPARSPARPDDPARDMGCGGGEVPRSRQARRAHRRLRRFTMWTGGGLGGASSRLAAADGPRRDALCPRPDRRGLRAERGRHVRPLARDHDLIVCVDCGHAFPRRDRGGEGCGCRRARPPSRRRDPASCGRGGEPQPAGRGRQPRAPLPRQAWCF